MKRILMAFALMPFMALATTLNDGLVAWYKFDGDAKDSSGNGNDGAMRGATLVTDRKGNVNQSVYLGVGNWIQVPDSASLRSCRQNITISLWTRTDADHGYDINYVSKGTDHLPNDRQFSLAEIYYGEDGDYVAMNDPQNGLVDARIFTDCTSLLSVETWRHLTMTYDGFYAKTYINGVLVSISNVVSEVGVSTGDMFIGKDMGGYVTEYCQATIDDLRIYNRTLSADEVKLLYTQTLYVNGTTGSDSNPGTSPESAKKTIQAAIDVSTDGDEILVAPGTYAPIVSHAKKISIVGCGNVRDVVIDGGGARVCAILCDVNEGNTNTILRGFTLRNGYSHDDYGAAGVTYPGAATYRGKVENCMITKCTGPTIVVGSAAYNCLIYSNKVTSTGVLMHNTAYNCTVVDNDSAYTTWDNGLYNVLCWNSGGWYTSPGMPENHYNCYKSIENPKFADLANGDYRLAAGSPCIDAGNNDYVMGDKDLEGCGRIVNGTVDIGCYEFEPDGGPYVETVGDVDWTYMIKNGRASVGDGVSAAITTTTGGAVTIPDRLRTRPVVALDEKALANCNDITEVVIPASVKTIGDSAFEGCGKLADVYFEGDTLSSIGLDAFRGCYWDLIMHVYPTWQGRGKTICGYTVMNSASADVKMTVTNVMVHYIQTSELSPMAAPITPDVGIVNVMTEIEGGIVAVPESWATNYPSFKQKFGNDFAVALTHETGKFDANRKPMRVWQDYVAGTDPTDVTDQFRASVTMVEGKPVISYTPVLSETEAAKRVYTIYGKVKLQDEEWTAIPEGQEADYNFFKVTVKMK